MDSKNIIDTQKVIDLLGGNAKTADLWQVTPGAVSQWLTNGLPRAFVKFLQVQRPDVYTAASGKPKRRTPAGPPPKKASHKRTPAR